jgi:hypothetical protein
MSCLSSQPGISQDVCDTAGSSNHCRRAGGRIKGVLIKSKNKTVPIYDLHIIVDIENPKEFRERPFL